MPREMQLLVRYQCDTCIHWTGEPYMSVDTFDLSDSRRLVVGRSVLLVHQAGYSGCGNESECADYAQTQHHKCRILSKKKIPCCIEDGESF